MNPGYSWPSLSFSLAIKLASIAVHADELTSPSGNMIFDGPAIRTLVHDPEVQAFLRALDPALLPVKRATVTREER